MDTLWVSVSGFFILGTIGVIVEHINVGKWIKDKCILLIGGLMALSVLVGLIASVFG